MLLRLPRSAAPTPAACARPVIGSAVRGIKLSVVDEVTGYLVPPHDPEALAQRLERLHDNPALAEALGRAGARRVRERFTWEQVGNALVEVYAAAGAKLARGPTRSAAHASVSPLRLSSQRSPPRATGEHR